VAGVRRVWSEVGGDGRRLRGNGVGVGAACAAGAARAPTGGSGGAGRGGSAQLPAAVRSLRVRGRPGSARRRCPALRRDSERSAGGKRLRARVPPGGYKSPARRRVRGGHPAGGGPSSARLSPARRSELRAQLPAGPRGTPGAPAPLPRLSVRGTAPTRGLVSELRGSGENEVRTR